MEGVNLSRDSQFFERDTSVKTELYSGKTLRPANLSNEYDRMRFLIFRFPENRPLECRFPVKKTKWTIHKMVMAVQKKQEKLRKVF